VTGTADVYQAYLAALRAGDRRRAFRVVDDARAGGLDVGVVYLEVFQPALREIGRLWQVNEVTVAEEHLATAITQAAMARLYESAFSWSADAGPTLVAACVDTERHEVGLRMLCDLLDLRGWETHYLGASVPMESLVAMVLARRPDVVALSATIAPHLPRVRAIIAALREATGAAAPLILLGGRPFLDDPALAWQLGADLTARDAGEAVEQLCARVSCK
jgi:MerR family transcriptional regulator, light-induced transcriptional regulator